MTPEEPETPPARRKPYERPQVFRVALRPDEAVLGSCKTALVAGPVEANCGALGGCFTIGS